MNIFHSEITPSHLAAQAGYWLEVHSWVMIDSNLDGY